ncbi:hypothetical protein GQ44DRAFT_451604 [Phaeosphaeriaceae sp. PMI808]|nr:hypothetical protein GQ44DRAFT_451604 [Phaeosphaeriaceae sp. PMI808]
MNIIRKLKRQRKETEKRNEVRKKLLSIPSSRLSGIDALPVELWGEIVDYVVVVQLGDPRWQCCEIPNILQLRLTCSAFDKEVQRSLHQHILLGQVPRLALLLTLIRTSLKRENDTKLHTSVLASAMYNSSRALASNRRARLATPRIVNRIRNCTTIASTLCPLIDPTSKNPNPGPKELMRRFCNAASTSIYCHEYMYMSSAYVDWFGLYAEDEAYLEVALLVACGFSKEGALESLFKLAKQGKLAPYIVGRPDRTIMRARRWNYNANRLGLAYRYCLDA